ncbi:hypothetical protein LTR85_009069 [Meristemomyces frigidus]|nr:hypothetical protein LTR85_009069 [Meristemomyces frigidus]
MVDSEDLLICVACGTQFDIPADKPPKGCRICDDPRQFIPPGGQTWTSLSKMRAGNYQNKFKPVGESNGEESMTSIWTEPKFGIGQRAIFVAGTHLEWAKVFECPVFVAKDDEEWLNRADADGRRILFAAASEEVEEGVTAVKTGGHSPGGFFVTTPSALYHIDRLPGTTSYAFMWAVPNMIPLPPAELHKMWQAIKPFEFESTHGAFVGQEVRAKEVKGRVLESMKIQTKDMGWEEHAVLKESWP